MSYHGRRTARSAILLGAVLLAILSGCASRGPASRPGSAEELWIIVKGSAGQSQAPVPGVPALVCQLPGQAEPVAIAPTRARVQAQITGFIASVDVAQEFRNPTDRRIDAVYTFPLPADAAVTDFLLTIGQRKIRGVIRARSEADRLYAEARKLGHAASLLTQGDASTFRQLVAGIEPRAVIEAQIKMVHSLEYEDGWIRYAYPAVETDLSVGVQIDAGAPIGQVESANHPISVIRSGESRAAVEQKTSVRSGVPFVLRYKVAGNSSTAALLTHRDHRGGYFALVVIPPENPDAGLSIDWGSMIVSDVQPPRLPDLSGNRPVMITGRFSGAGTTTLRVHSGLGSTIEIPVNLNEATATRPAIALAWARMKLSALAAAAQENPNGGSAQSLRQLALDYGLLSEYTAFVLVDSRPPPAARRHRTRRGG